MDEQDIQSIKTRLEELRALNKGVFSGGFYDLKEKKVSWEQIGYVCSASFVEKESWSNPNKVPYAIFDGDMEGGRSSKRKGTEVSMTWLKFMLDPEKSFAKNAIPYIVNREDLEWINEKGGFIFAPGALACPAVEMKALVIGLRQGQEYNGMIHRFHELVHTLGIDERLAFPLAARYTWNNLFEITGYAKSVNSNHEVFGYSIKSWAKASYDGVSAKSAKTIGDIGHTRRAETDYVEEYVGSYAYNSVYATGSDEDGDRYAPGAGYFKYTKGMKVEEMLEVLKKHIGV